MGSEIGTIAGIMGVMSTNSNGDWTFTRLVEGPALAVEGAVQFVCHNAEQMSERCAWLWLGRNGAGMGRLVEADIAAAVTSLSHERYLIGEILASANDTAAGRLAIAQQNQALSDLYKERFIPLVAELQSFAVGEEDEQDVLDGLVPRSLRSDAIHLNDAGYGIVAQQFVAKTLSLGF